MESPKETNGDGANGVNGTMHVDGLKFEANDEDLLKATEPVNFEDVNWDEVDKNDDTAIANLISEKGDLKGVNIKDFNDRVLDQSGKADDAIDYEDISDGDLASDAASDVAVEPRVSQVPPLTEDEDTTREGEDLFGDEDHILPPSSPHQQAHADPLAPAAAAPPKTLNDVSDEQWASMSFEERQRINFPSAAEDSVNEWMSGLISQQESELPAPPQSIEELLHQRFPGFTQNKVLYQNELFPEWPAEFQFKEPHREAAEFNPSKLELDIEGDSAKIFRIPENALSTTQKRTQPYYNDGKDWSLGIAAPLGGDDAMSDSDSENELVGGYTLTELATVCDDWNALLDGPVDSLMKDAVEEAEDEDEDMDEWQREYLSSQPKKTKAKRPKYTPGLPDITSFEVRGVDNFFDATRRSAKRVRLDLNDPYLLVDDMQGQRTRKRPRVEEKTKRMANGQLGADVKHRFNISNDEAYDALKANHKSKVRATLSNLAVEHSMPALKLTYPFYRTRIKGEFWEHHRKKIELDKITKHAVPIKKPSKTKRRDLKGRKVQDIFKTTKDLSLNDNSSAVLFEYCEQFPIMMSNFGMGSRVINYYRRKDKTDEEKPPKTEIGEPHVLLPEDRSPFSIFGTVDAGETVPTLHNEMYRAPIFKHEPRKHDFLLGFSTNVTDGPRFYLRKIDHLYVVGQTFPSLEVPGPHARKVTNTTKNRLKMISYRMMRKRETLDVNINELTPHVFEKVDPQNRQKMKEFLNYDRETKTWVLPEGQTMPDESAIRSMIKPEDACLIEAMQVGERSLHNAGFDTSKKDQEDDADEDKPLILKMTPWQITKNFIDASAGKAMVSLHGDGDPTGHGLGFSFIKTSMKGGYISSVQGPLATSADAIERERKANGGHSYNVKKQQDMYNTAIRGIWERQKESLSDLKAYEDKDVLDTSNEDDRLNRDATPAATHFDDGRSQLSHLSGASRSGRKKLKITRRKRNAAGEIVTETVIISNERVARNYAKMRRDMDEANRDVYALKPTGDADADRENTKLVERELSRLLKNADRRQVREKQGKGKRKKDTGGDAGSPDPSGTAEKAAAGTTRKCANCGQVGHIKTNKSKCPLLNGTISTNNNAAEHGGFGSFSTPAVGSQPGESG